MIVTYQAVDHNFIIARQSTLKSELRHILADGEDDHLFVDTVDGIWFGGVNKTKSGTIVPQAQHTKESIAYSSHLQRIMSSPPKKCPITPAKSGGGVPHFVPQHTPQTNSPSPQTFMVTPQNINVPTPGWSTFNHRFDAMQHELIQQRECNARFDTRISNLENTSKNIDSKIDKILDQLDSTFPTPHKIQRTSPSSYNDAFSHSAQASTILNIQGNTYNDA